VLNAEGWRLHPPDPVDVGDARVLMGLAMAAVMAGVPQRDRPAGWDC
jgi:hypothetical protein